MKLLTHLAPRAGASAAFGERAASLTAELREAVHADGLSVTRLVRLDESPFGRRAPWHTTLEIRGEGVTPERAAELLAGVGGSLDGVAHPDLCTALFGEGVVFVASTGAPQRYQYLMRRNASFDHAGYLKRYREVHSRFGVETPGILGYEQLHVDPEASRRVALAAGFGIWNVDSVSELYLESQEVFLSALAESGFGSEAIADEEVFVDRANSVDLCSQVAMTSPD
jgi:hypothetical protein